MATTTDNRSPEAVRAYRALCWPNMRGVSLTGSVFGWALRNHTYGHILPAGVNHGHHTRAWPLLDILRARDGLALARHATLDRSTRITEDRRVTEWRDYCDRRPRPASHNPRDHVTTAYGPGFGAADYRPEELADYNADPSRSGLYWIGLDGSLRWSTPGFVWSAPDV